MGLTSFFKVGNVALVNGSVSTHNGLIGMLERAEIDIAIADLALTFPRAEVQQT